MLNTVLRASVHLVSRVALMAGFFNMICVAAPVYGYKVVAVYPHSTTSYTEGFFYLNGLFYESTGLKGHSQFLSPSPRPAR